LIPRFTPFGVSFLGKGARIEGALVTQEKNVEALGATREELVFLGESSKLPD
jgi:hypothetical protein